MQSPFEYTPPERPPISPRILDLIEEYLQDQDSPEDWISVWELEPDSFYSYKEGQVSLLVMRQEPSRRRDAEMIPRALVTIMDQEGRVVVMEQGLLLGVTPDGTEESVVRQIPPSDSPYVPIALEVDEDSSFRAISL